MILERFYLFIWICGFYFIIGIFAFPEEKFEGDSCKNGGERGICTLITKCIPALKSLKKYNSHNYKRCGFDSFIEIVCCPPNKPQINHATNDETLNGNSNNKAEIRSPIPQNMKKSERACIEFSNYDTISVAFHIVNGENAQKGEFPHMAAIGNRTKDNKIEFLCGGTLISERYVVTAAHCFVTSLGGKPPDVVRLGALFLAEDIYEPLARDYNIENFTLHPDYKWKEKIHDIALVKLGSKAEINEFIYPACLYTKADDPLGLIITGWGSVAFGEERSVVLQKAYLVAVPLKECNTTLHNRDKRQIFKSQICASYNGSDACQGDSGGPLQVQDKVGSSMYSLVGVTSYGIGCGGKYPGVYTRIYSYLDWIESIVWP